MVTVMRYFLLFILLLGAQGMKAQKMNDGEGSERKLLTTVTLPGDVNSDGTHSITDVMMMVNHIVGKGPAGFHAEVADLDGNAVVNITDVMILINIIIGKMDVPVIDPDNPVIPVDNPEGGDPAEGI